MSTEQSAPILTPEPPREHRWKGQPRNSWYVPGWYQPHTHDHEVRDQGRGLGFRISQVMDYRRWAIQPDGELLDQRDFEDQYRRYMAEWAVPRNFNFANLCIPSTRAFVDLKELDGSFIPILFDPFRKPERPIEAKYNQEGEISKHFLEEQAKLSRDLERRQVLDELLRKGLISQQAYLKESLADAPALTEDPRAPAPEPPPPNHQAKDARARPKAERTALCGKILYSQEFGFRAHERTCKRCKKVREDRALQQADSGTASS